MTNLVQRFELNTIGRDFVVGDIHGMFRLLQSELENIGFDPQRDRLFSVGDLVDRGPDSDMALAWIAKPWFHAVQGNHEDMATRWPSGNMDADRYTANGGGWNVSQPAEAQRQFADELGALPIAIQIETVAGSVGIVHAECPFPAWADFITALEYPYLKKRELAEIREVALWSRERIQSEDQSSIPDLRALVVGHTPLKHPAILGNVYYIDTGACFSKGYFTFINLATLETMPPTPKKLDWSEA